MRINIEQCNGTQFSGYDRDLQKQVVAIEENENEMSEPDLYLHGSTKKSRNILVEKEPINKNCNSSWVLEQRYWSIKGSAGGIHIRSYKQILLHSVAPDVKAAGASLCSGKSAVLSLHEAAADGKHEARMGLKPRDLSFGPDRLNLGQTWLCVCWWIGTWDLRGRIM